MNEIDRINSFFVERHISLKQDWLRSAIEYVRSITRTNEINQGIVYELWKYSDIKESTHPCITDDIKNAKEFNGTMVLQIQAITDIGTSYLSQFKKLVYVASDNAEFQMTDNNADETQKESGSQLLQLILSDGVSQIKAVEYKRVCQLSLLICPGCKIVLYGGIQVRRDVFLLKPENCQLLGGDVEALLKTNRPVEIMAAKLRIPVPTQRPPSVITASDVTMYPLPRTAAARPTAATTAAVVNHPSLPPGPTQRPSAASITTTTAPNAASTALRKRCGDGSTAGDTQIKTNRPTVVEALPPVAAAAVNRPRVSFLAHQSTALPSSSFSNDARMAPPPPNSRQPPPNNIEMRRTMTNGDASAVTTTRSSASNYAPPPRQPPNDVKMSRQSFDDDADDEVVAVATTSRHDQSAATTPKSANLSSLATPTQRTASNPLGEMVINMHHDLLQNALPFRAFEFKKKILDVVGEFEMVLLKEKK